MIPGDVVCTSERRGGSRGEGACARIAVDVERTEAAVSVVAGFYSGSSGFVMSYWFLLVDVLAWRKTKTDPKPATNPLPMACRRVREPNARFTKTVRAFVCLSINADRRRVAR